MGNKSNRIPLPADTLTHLIENSHFKKNEIKHIYHKFMKVSPDGNLTKTQFINLYKMRDSKDDIDVIAGHMFRAFDLNNSYTVGNITSFLIFIYLFVCMSLATVFVLS